MKKRNTTIFAFLLLAAVGMGVGYAALSDELQINGTAKAGFEVANDEWDADIYFSDAKITSKTPGSEATMTPTGLNGDELTIPVENMSLKGEKVTVSVTIKNDNVDYAADLIEVTAFNYTSAVDGDFTIECDFDANEVIAKNGGTYTFDIVITLNVQPTEELSATFGLKFQAQAIDEKR